MVQRAQELFSSPTATSNVSTVRTMISAKMDKVMVTHGHLYFISCQNYDISQDGQGNGNSRTSLLIYCQNYDISQDGQGNGNSRTSLLYLLSEL